MLKSLLKDVWANSTKREEKETRVTDSDRTDQHLAWLDALLLRMFQLLHNSEKDNFDSDRYRGISPSDFYYAGHAAYFSFFLKHAHEFFRSRSLFGDESSKALFDQLILFRILGHLHVRLPVDSSGMRVNTQLAATWKIGETADTGILGPLALFSIPNGDAKIVVKCWTENAAASFLFDQYYFSRGAVRVAATEGDYVLDAGGCFGDTALRFAHVVGANGHVFTFDPLDKHCEIMHDNFESNPKLKPRISIFQLGLSDRRNDVIAAPSTGRIDPGAAITDDSFPTRTIDELVSDGTMAKIDFIKMDIEGSELAALAGAETSLKKWKPELAISLYHRPEDFFAIPLWIDSLSCGYRFYLDHYSIHHEETVLYATTEE